jgi:hypothetical protein
MKEIYINRELHLTGSRACIVEEVERVSLKVQSVSGQCTSNGRTAFDSSKNFKAVKVTPHLRLHLSLTVHENLNSLLLTVRESLYLPTAGTKIRPCAQNLGTPKSPSFEIAYCDTANLKCCQI